MLGRAPPTLFAASRVNGHAGKFPLRLERFGRVFAKNQLLGEYGVDAVNRDVDLLRSTTRKTLSSWRPTTSVPTVRG